MHISISSSEREWANCIKTTRSFFYQLSQRTANKSNSKQVIFSQAVTLCKFSCEPWITIEIPGKSCDVHITECTSNVRIKICSEKVLSWDCHAGTDAKRIAQKLCWAGSLSGMEDMDYWSCKLHSNLKMGVLLGRKADVFLKDTTVQFPAKQNWQQKLWETDRKKKKKYAIQVEALSEEQCWALGHEQKWKP